MGSPDVCRGSLDARQISRFLLVGASTTALYFGILLAGVELLALPITLASSVACIIAIIYNYLLHYRWTFASEAPHGVVLGRYLLMNLGGLMINGSIMYFGVPMLGVHYLWVQLLAAALMIGWTLTLSSLWVYRS